MTSTRISAVNDEMLRSVTGGNYGDEVYEYTNNVQLHYVGEIVEVYRNLFHITTKRATIISVRIAKAYIISYQQPARDVPAYTVRYEDGTTEEVLSCRIER